MKIRKTIFCLYLPLLVLTTALFHFSVYADSQISFYRDNYAVRSFGKSLIQTKDGSNYSVDFGSLLVEWFSSDDALSSGLATSDNIDIRLCFKRLRQSNDKTPVNSIKLAQSNSAGSLRYESNNVHYATVILSADKPSGSAELSYDPFQLEPDPQCPVFIHNKQSQQGEVPSRVTVSTSSDSWDKHLSQNTLIPYEQNTASGQPGEVFAGGGSIGPDDQNNDDFFKRPGGGRARPVSFEWSLNPYQWYLVLAGLPVETNEPAIRLIVWHDGWRNTEIPIDINLWQRLRLFGHHRDPQVLGLLSQNPFNPAEAYGQYLAQHPELTYQRPDTTLILNPKELNRLELIPGRTPTPVSRPNGQDSCNSNNGPTPCNDHGQLVHTSSPTHSQNRQSNDFNRRDEDEGGNGSRGSNLCDCGQPRFRGSLYCKRCISNNEQTRLQRLVVTAEETIAEETIKRQHPPAPELIVDILDQIRLASLSTWFVGLNRRHFDHLIGIDARFNLQQIRHFVFLDHGIILERPNAVESFLTLFGEYETGLINNKQFIVELIQRITSFSIGSEKSDADRRLFSYQLLYEFFVQITQYHERYLTSGDVRNLRELLSVISKEATGNSSKYPFKIINPAYSDASSGASGNSELPKLNGHTVSVHKTAMRAIDTIGTECVICRDELKDDGLRFPRSLSELDCGHLFHTDCVNSAREVRANCPLCNLGCKGHSDPKVHSYRDGMIASLTAQCSEDTCEIQSVGQAGDYECPYPLSLLSLSKPGCFIRENKQVLTDWIKNYFTAQGYRRCNVFSEGDQDEFSVIRVNLNSDGRFVQCLIYSDSDIKGLTARQCFETLLEDVKADKLVLDFQKKHPKYFNGTSELTITDWNIHEDSVTLSRRPSISFRAIINSENNAIDLDRLLSEVSRHGNDQRQRYKGPLTPFELPPPFR